MGAFHPYYRRMIAGVAVQQFYPATGVRQTNYLLKDHLGSTHTILSDTGAIVQRQQFDAFGTGIDPDNWFSGLLSPSHQPRLYWSLLM